MTDFAALSIAGRIATPDAPDWGEARAAWNLAAAISPWGADGACFNFTEDPCDVDKILPADVCTRLAEVKRDWGPDGRILANHAVSLGEA